MSLYPPLVPQSGSGVAVLNDADAGRFLSCPVLGGKGKIWPTLDLDALGRCCSDSCRWTIDVGGESGPARSKWPDTYRRCGIPENRVRGANLWG